MEPNYTIFAIYLFVGMLIGLCAGLIIARIIHRWREARRTDYIWTTDSSGGQDERHLR